MAKAVCIGEAMAVLVPDQPGPLEHVDTFHHTTGGAEFNVARTLAALGRPRPRPPVCFDLNWRPALWTGRDPAVLADLLNRADIVLAGADEAGAVFGTADPAALRALLPGPATLVVKAGAEWAAALDAE